MKVTVTQREFLDELYHYVKNGCRDFPQGDEVRSKWNALGEDGQREVVRWMKDLWAEKLWSGG